MTTGHIVPVAHKKKIVSVNETKRILYTDSKKIVVPVNETKRTIYCTEKPNAPSTAPTRNVSLAYALLPVAPGMCLANSCCGRTARSCCGRTVNQSYLGNV